jgi:hypothetical protein
LLINCWHYPRFWRNELLRGNTKLEHSGKGARKVLEPQILVISISLGILLKRLVLSKNVIGSEKKKKI